MTSPTFLLYNPENPNGASLFVDTQNVSINNTLSYLINKRLTRFDRLNTVNCYHFIAVLNCDRLIAVEPDVQDDERRRNMKSFIFIFVRGDQ